MCSEDLKFRFCWHFPSAILDSIISKGITSYTGDETIKIGGMKIFMDGSLGSQSAWMYEPYSGTENYGMVILPEEELYKLVKKGALNGVSSTIHGIGDRCNNLILRVFERVNNELGVKLPHRIEHLQCIRPEDHHYLIENDVYCAVQPVHIKADVETIKEYWPHCEKNVYPLKSLLNKGVTLGFGSDAPVETINPFEGIYSAVTRKYLNKPENESWTPEQTLSVMQAIRGYTIDAAKGSMSEKLRGSIEQDKLADLIILDSLPGTTNSSKELEEWLCIESDLTMIAGEIVYQKMADNTEALNFL